MGYKYFVAFISKCKDDNEKHYGNAIIGFRKTIESLDDIMEIQDDIKKLGEYETVVVTNFILLKEENIDNEEGDHIPRID